VLLGLAAAEEEAPTAALEQAEVVSVSLEKAQVAVLTVVVLAEQIPLGRLAARMAEEVPLVHLTIADQKCLRRRVAQRSELSGPVILVASPRQIQVICK